MQAFVADKPQLGFALILQLTGVNGSQQFDKLTKTKTIESILSSLDARGIQSYIDHLLGQIDDAGSTSYVKLLRCFPPLANALSFVGMMLQQRTPGGLGLSNS